MQAKDEINSSSSYDEVREDLEKTVTDEPTERRCTRQRRHRKRKGAFHAARRECIVRERKSNNSLYLASRWMSAWKEHLGDEMSGIIPKNDGVVKRTIFLADRTVRMNSAHSRPTCASTPQAAL